MIRFHRGDTRPLKFKIINKDKSKTFGPDDIRELYFTLKTDKNSRRVFIQKTKNDFIFDDDGIWHFVIKPEDTERMAYGKYYYDIEVTLLNGFRQTKDGYLEITGEATTHGY